MAVFQYNLSIMKKIVVILFAVLCLFTGGVKADAQTWFTGGEFTAVYGGVFSYKVKPMVGYEFNDKIAVQANLGVSGAHGAVNQTNFIAGAYFRYTPWHNDVLFVDLKLRTEVLTSRGYLGADLGIVPELRFRCNPHWDVFAAVGSLGARYDGGAWSPFVGIISNNTIVGFIYRFGKIK